MHSGNLQGGFRFMALNIGNKIVRRISGVIPMPDTVITRVNTLVSKQPEQLVFTDRHRRPISDVKFSGVDLLDADLIEIPGVDSMDVDNIYSWDLNIINVQWIQSWDLDMVSVQ